MNSAYSMLMFIIGLGSATRIVLGGSFAISELFILPVAPFIFLKDYCVLRRDGFLPVLVLIGMTMIGCLVASMVNGTPMFRSVKVLAQYYSIFSVVVITHRALSANPASLKWLIVGTFISGLITIFAFNETLKVDVGGAVAVADRDVSDVLQGELFWGAHLNRALNVLLGGFYYEMPYIVSISAPIVCIVIIALTSVSGRSLSFALLCGWGLMAYCGKRQNRMYKISRHFLVLCTIGFVFLLSFKGIYKKLATGGHLGEAARIKYDIQTKGGDSLLRLLMGGRVEFFIGMRAAIDRPLIGYGVFPEDKKGYVAEFLKQYGDEGDYRRYIQSLYDGTNSYGIIPTHSYLVGGWIFCGVMGLLLWIYVLYLCLMLFKKWIIAIPQWFGFFSLGIPLFVWDIFFSPITNRITPAIMISCLLIAKAVYEKRIALPYAMSEEIIRHGGYRNQY